MSWYEVRQKYGTGSPREVLNRAIRATVPGGNGLLDALHQLNTEVRNPGHHRSHAERRELAELLADLDDLLDRHRDRLVARLVRGIAEPPPQPALPPASVMPARQPVRADNRDWRPPAAIVERMGRESDESLARECGVSPAAIAAARSRLDISETAAKVARSRHCK